MEFPFPEMRKGAGEGQGQVGNQEFSFNHVKLEMPLETTKQRAAQAAGWIYGSGVQERGLGWEYRLGSHQGRNEI